MIEGSTRVVAVAAVVFVAGAGAGAEVVWCMRADRHAWVAFALEPEWARRDRLEGRKGEQMLNFEVKPTDARRDPLEEALWAYMTSHQSDGAIQHILVAPDGMA